MKNFFHTHKNSIIFILVIILFGGVFIYRKMQVSLFPEITFPKIKIIADDGEQPVDKMMLTVTRPLEEAIKHMEGLKLIRSSTSRGSCEINAFMEWESDIYRDQQLIESRINQIRNNLPSDIKITIERMNPSILPVIDFSLESNDKSLIELKQIGNYVVKPFLSQLDGVSSVQVIGGKEKEYWLELQPQKMTALGITPAMISDAVAHTDFINSNGYLSDYRRLYLTLTDAGLYTKADLENVVVRSDGNRIVFQGKTDLPSMHPLKQLTGSLQNNFCQCLSGQ